MFWASIFFQFWCQQNFQDQKHLMQYISTNTAALSPVFAQHNHRLQATLVLSFKLQQTLHQVSCLR